jgi:hypothetical protein
MNTKDISIEKDYIKYNEQTGRIIIILNIFYCGEFLTKELLEVENNSTRK